MTQPQQKEYTWDDLANAVGQDFSGGETRTAVDDVERGAIRKYGEPLEFDCPLHYDDEVAKKYGYKGIIAPYSAIHATFMSAALWNPGDPPRWPTAEPDQQVAHDPSESRSNAPPLPMPRTTASFVTDMEVEYLIPVYVGDNLTSSGRKLISVNVRKTSVGFGAFMVFEGEIRNQRGEVVAKVRNGGYSYNPGAES